MRWNTLSVVPLILLAAAAAPAEDCASPASAIQTPPVFLDETSQPVGDGQVGNNAAGCQHELRLPDRSDPLRSQSDNILHGLPRSDSLRRIDEPRQPPMFQ